MAGLFFFDVALGTARLEKLRAVPAGGARGPSFSPTPLLLVVVVFSFLFFLRLLVLHVRLSWGKIATAFSS